MHDDWLSRIALSVPLEGSEDSDVEVACTSHHRPCSLRGRPAHSLISPFLADELDVPVESVSREPTRVAKALEILRTPRTDDSGLTLDFYNWSNDHYYPPQKAQKVTIRQTGLIEIIHAGPAVKLQMPFVSGPSIFTASISRTLTTICDLSTSLILRRPRNECETDRCCSSLPACLSTSTSSCHLRIGPSSRERPSRRWRDRGRRLNPRSPKVPRIYPWRIGCPLCSLNIR